MLTLASAMSQVLQAGLPIILGGPTGFYAGMRGLRVTLLLTD